MVQLDNVVKDFELLMVPVMHKQMIAAQRDDPSLVKCFSAAEHPKTVKNIKAKYMLDDGLLLRK